MHSTPRTRHHEERTAQRFETDMLVTVSGAPGRMCNISAQGAYFLTDVPQQVGALLNFTVEYTLYGRRHRLLCEGKVVRVEERDGRVGVAARLVAPFFEEDAPQA